MKLGTVLSVSIVLAFYFYAFKNNISIFILTYNFLSKSRIIKLLNQLQKQPKQFINCDNQRRKCNVCRSPSEFAHTHASSAATTIRETRDISTVRGNER